MLALYVLAQSSLAVLPLRLSGLGFRLPGAVAPGMGTRSPRSRDERGQASAEYALVLLGAAAVALLVTGWAARTDRVGRLLDAVMDEVLSRVK